MAKSFLGDIGDKCVGAIQESPVPENGTWAGRFVNRPYNFVADPWPPMPPFCFTLGVS
jgi:hypothetical protein